MRSPLARFALALTLVLAFANTAATAKAPAGDPPAASNDTLRLSIEDATQRAMQRGAEARIARARVDAAHGRVHEALADAFPQLSGTLQYTRTFSSVFQGASSDTIFGPLLENSPFAAANQWNASVTASQTLFSRKVGIAVSAARVFQKATAADRREAEAQLVLGVRRAYYGAAAARRMMDIAQETLAQARAHLHDVELLYKQGLRAEYDWIRAQVDARNEEPNLIAARNTWKTAMLELRKLVDVAPGTPLVLTTPLEFGEGRVPVAVLDSVAAPHRALLESAEDNVVLHRKAVTIEAANRWPSLSASATLSQQAFPPESWPLREQFHRDLEGSLKLEVPLFLGGRTQGAIGRSKAELHEAEATRDRARQNAAIELEQARQEARRSLAELAARRGTVELARRGFRIADVRYRGGLSTSLELADARLQLSASEVNEVQAIRDYLNALAWLEFAQGEPPAIRYVSLEDLPSGGAEDTEP